MQYMNRQAPLTRAEKEEQAREREARAAALRMKNNRLGLTLFQGSWIMIFVCLVIVYWQMGFQPGWRPTPELAPSPILPTVATVAILISAWFAHRALQQVKTVEQGTAAIWQRDWLMATGLGAAFFIIMMTQFFAVPAGGDGLQFGYIYRTMIGYHAIHAVAIGFMMIQVMRFAADGRYHRDNHWSIEATAKLWYFVVGAWLLFFAVLYLPFLL